MPGGDHIRVDPDDLNRHAAHLDRCADSLDTAQGAGRHVRLDADAYGQLCAIMPALLDGLQQTLVDGVGTAAGSVRDTAAKLRSSAVGYRATDSRAARHLDRIRDGR
ncbi:type VII secretion target [Micromonospora sp. WMMD734]|uniref:ESX-1 secretion-associated protein n=1 Tax=Micromonospora humidisoli TaxID=2807622 RepID=A0ABS2JDG4_9ACTN|nr:type VII secretion target [Micromonospora humidisoli]MBM7084590.1 ESX-1 secretion-associated protein [Micromonospora humidisoli]